MNVCVFCGSASGNDPQYAESVRELGSSMGSAGISLVYGGGNIGLMGTIADSVMDAGGEVIGVIPEFLVNREVGHRGITRLEIVASMHERKQRMASLAHAFLALPGGWGTLEELAEILTWRQLGLIDQPVIIFNLLEFFDPLLHQMRRMKREGFLMSSYLDIIQVVSNSEEAMNLLSRKKG